MASRNTAQYEKSASWSWASQENLAVGAAILLGIALHVQPTFSVLGSEIRLSLSDLMTPFLLPLVVWIWLSNKSALKPSLPYVITAALAGTIVISYGLVIGISRFGRIESWALVKYVGWFALLFYAALGAALAIAGHSRAVNWFVLTFVGVHVLLVTAFLIMAVIGLSWPGLHSPRMSGFITNPNAYGLALLFAIALLLSLKQSFGFRLSGLRWEVTLGLLIAGLLYSRSLGALMALGAMFIVFLLLRRWSKALLRALIFALVIYAVPVASNPVLSHFGITDSSRLFGRGIEDKARDPDKYSFSISRRLDSLNRSIAAWREHPWLGTGLGRVLAADRDKEANGRPAFQIHNTAVWLLAEFGIIGLAVFAGVFISVFVYLSRAMHRLRDRDPPYADIMLAGLLVLVGWGTMSLAHELMYQRVPWFILGLCGGAGLLASRNNRLSS